jgi:hypothetical protein
LDRWAFLFGRNWSRTGCINISLKGRGFSRAAQSSNGAGFSP